jgi:ketosteroid isomerase-like protein
MATNLDLARGSYEAYTRGDMDAYIDFFSPGTEWRTSAMLTGKTHYAGHEGIREFIADVARLSDEHSERFVPLINDFSEIDENRVLGLGSGRILREENPIEFETGLIYTFVDGKIAELDVFTSHSEAREAAGLA